VPQETSFSRETRWVFDRASAETKADAEPVLGFLSQGFQISWFREERRRIWHAIVKPHPLVSEQFALPLEYFVIGHGFPADFHQRTLLIEPPTEEAYRLDHRLRFVASPAALLKASCAAWAQERHIAVVPIDAKAAASSTDPRADLFALLSQALWRRDVLMTPYQSKTQPSSLGANFMCNSL